jgi:putative phosphoesterase
VPRADRLHCALSVALVADTHGFLDERIAAEVSRCDIAVHAGDVGAGAVLAAMRPRRSVVHAIRGNNDVSSKWTSSEREMLESLGTKVTLALPGGVLVAVHGDRAGPARRRHAWLRARYPHARAVVYGHSHRLCCDCSATPWVVNPGAAGRARTYGGPSCLILRIDGEHWGLEPRRFEPLAPRRR